MRSPAWTRGATRSARATGARSTTSAGSSTPRASRWTATGRRSWPPTDPAAAGPAHAPVRGLGARRHGVDAVLQGAWYRCCNGQIRKLVDCCSTSRTRINGDALWWATAVPAGGSSALYTETGVPCSAGACSRSASRRPRSSPGCPPPGPPEGSPWSRPSLPPGAGRHRYRLALALFSAGAIAAAAAWSPAGGGRRATRPLLDRARAGRAGGAGGAARMGRAAGAGARCASAGARALAH